MLHRSKERCACYGVGQTLVSSEQGKSAFHEYSASRAKTLIDKYF
jgi:hypothetical protein